MALSQSAPLKLALHQPVPTWASYHQAALAQENSMPEARRTAAHNPAAWIPSPM